MRRRMGGGLWTRNFTILTLGTVVSMLGNAISGFAVGLMALPGPYLDRVSRVRGDLRLGLSFRSHLCAAGRAAVYRLVSVAAHAAGRAGARRHRQRVCHRLRQPLPHPGLQGKPAKGLLGVLADHAPGLGDGAGGRLSVRPHGPGAHVCHQRRQLPGRGPVRNADPRAGGTPGPAARLCGGPGPGRALYPRRARVAGRRRLLHPQRPAGRLLAADAALLQGHPGPWRAVVHLCGRLVGGLVQYRFRVPWGALCVYALGSALDGLCLFIPCRR